MAKFRFRLATLLRLREAARDERREKLAEAYHAEQTLQERRRELEAELAQMMAPIGDGAPGRVDVDRMIEATRYQGILRVEVNVIERQHETLSGEIERRRLALVEADREVRVLEKLREQQRDRFDQEQRLVEAKVLDEFATQAVANARRGGL